MKGINIDQTLPSIVATQFPLANAADWINVPLSITYFCHDGFSGIVVCAETSVLSNDGVERKALAFVRGFANNSARADIVGVNIDQEPPLGEFDGVEDGGDYTLDQVPIAGCVTTDSLSGVLEEARLSIDGGTSNKVGLSTANCGNAVDVVGNTTSESASYLVRYVYDGFYSPVKNIPTYNKAKAGSSIPIKFRLDGDHGLYIFKNESPISTSVNCDSSAAINDTEETANNPGSSALAYSNNNDRYSYLWKTSKSWPGIYREFLLNLDDGSVHVVVFKFK